MNHQPVNEEVRKSKKPRIDKVFSFLTLKTGQVEQTKQENEIASSPNTSAEQNQLRHDIQEKEEKETLRHKRHKIKFQPYSFQEQGQDILDMQKSKS